jgi:hypothetical protein
MCTNSLFKEEGFVITFASPAMDSDFMVDLELVGAVKKSITLNCSSFDTFVKNLIHLWCCLTGL